MTREVTLRFTPSKKFIVRSFFIMQYGSLKTASRENDMKNRHARWRVPARWRSRPERARAYASWVQQ